MDEAFIDLSDYISFVEGALPAANANVDQLIFGGSDDVIFSTEEEQIIRMGNICQILRDDIKLKTGLIVSMGLGSNKLVTKIASSRFKPDCQTVVLPRFHKRMKRVAAMYFSNKSTRINAGCSPATNTTIQNKMCSHSRASGATVKASNRKGCFRPHPGNQ